MGGQYLQWISTYVGGELSDVDLVADSDFESRTSASRGTADLSTRCVIRHLCILLDAGQDAESSQNIDRSSSVSLCSLSH